MTLAGLVTENAAQVFEKVGQPLVARRFPQPELGPGEVLVRVRCCTICGSDLHTFLGRRTSPTPLILGHEILGEIIALDATQPHVDLREKNCGRAIA